MTDGYPTGRHAVAGAIPWLFGGALIVVAVFGIAFAVLLTGHGTPSGPGKHRQQALGAASPPAATTPAHSPSASASATKPAHKHSASPIPATSAAPLNTQQQASKPAAVQLSTTVSANSWNSSQSGLVAFTVHDTGPAAAGQVTVTISLPAGATMTSSGRGNGGGGGGDASLSPFAGHAHWNCQPTSAGATCTLPGLAAGNQAWGAIYFTVSGSSICGQPVDLTAVSGPASSSAQSTIAC